MAERRSYPFVFLLFLIPNLSESIVFSGKDVTPLAFLNNEEIFPVAYGDFNSDKITDIFTVSRDRSDLRIYFGYQEPPLFRLAIECKLRIDWVSKGFPGKNEKVHIVGATPADFTGDGILDVMVTFRRHPGHHNHDENNSRVEVVIFRGNLTTLDCGITVKKNQTIEMVQEPLLLDLNGDMIMDLFGEISGNWKPESESEHVSESVNSSRADVPNASDTSTTGSSSTTSAPDSFKKHNKHHQPGFWIFQASDNDTENPVNAPEFLPFYPMDPDGKDPKKTYRLTNPHCNAFVDVDGDFVPELVIVEEGWHGAKVLYQIKAYRVELEGDHSFTPKFTILYEPLDIDHKKQTNVIGQPLFIDMNQDGKLVELIPFCTKKDCQKSSGIKLITNMTSQPINLPIQFTDEIGKDWNFLPSNNVSVINSNYTQTIILRAGDYNLDGYPDLVGILRAPNGNPAMTGLRAVIFENVPCVPEPAENIVCENPRTFKINFDALAQYENAVLATFFDIHEDGLVDIVLVRRTNNATTPWADRYGVFAFQNSPDYDANFMKVMVLTGLDCPNCPEPSQIPYGNVISGPVITYHTTNQAGNYQTSVAAQMYRSSHNALDLPYTIFGIGQSPNFIETLQIFVSSTYANRTQIWSQIIPNSQLIVVPAPMSIPSDWSAKLFLTPSRAVLNTFGVLVGFCGLIFIIVAGLQFKEQREDRKGRLQEAHRFHMM